LKDGNPDQQSLHPGQTGLHEFIKQHL
jgi:hypothetical protein